MGQNIETFEKVIFNIPRLKTIITSLTLLGFIYSAVLYFSINAFAPININPFIIPLLAVFLFILPGVLSGEALYRFLPDYPRRWGYFLALSNQLIIFLYSLIMTGANDFGTAWKIFWLGLTTVYLANFLILMISIGQKYIRRISLLSLVHPLILLASFHFFLGSFLQIPLTAYMANFLVVIFAGIILLSVIVIAEYLIDTNIENVSVLTLTSGLFQKGQKALDIGYPTRPDVQTLEIENKEGKYTFAIPWVHPGPLEGFGGGKITSEIIEKLNQGGEGFFLHVPSTHKSDPTNPEDHSKILDALEEPEKGGRASKLVKKEYPEITFYGRRIGDKKIVFLETEDYDDYEMPVFREVIDTEDTVLVDLHNKDREQEDPDAVWYNTTTATQLRSNLKDFLEELEDQELEDYSAGFSTDLEGRSASATIEKVGGQKTLLMGVEGNGASKELRDLREKYREDYDEVLLFTTDTHASLKEMSSDQQVDPDRIINTVSKAESSLSKASIGFTNQKAAEMDLLQEDYSGLVFSVNILLRLLPLTLILLYLALVIWVL